jgi:hypothetical protein
MRSILGVGEPLDLSSQRNNQPKESKFEPTFIPKTASTYPTLVVKNNPAVHSIDEKLMNSMKSDYGSLYRRHFNGLEVDKNNLFSLSLSLSPTVPVPLSCLSLAFALPSDRPMVRVE